MHHIEFGDVAHTPACPLGKMLSMTTSVAFNIDLGQPLVTTVTTIAQPATVTYRYVKQSTSLDCFARVIMQVKPYHGPNHVLVEWDVKDEELFWYFPAIVAGIKAFANDEWSEVADLRHVTIQLKVTVIGGMTHSVDSRDSCFRIAAFRAMQQALAHGGRVPLVVE